MKNDDEPSYSGELAAMPVWDRSLWLSRAYLEAAQHLCCSMLEGDFSSQYSSSRVVLHLVRHGIELFLKGAIQAAGHATEPFGHNLDSLFLEYRKVYPQLSFSFSIPRVFLVDLNAELFPELMTRFHQTLDQRHRYATGKKGETFATPEVFDPIATLAEVEELRRILGIVEWAELRPYLKTKNAA